MFQGSISGDSLLKTTQWTSRPGTNSVRRTEGNDQKASKCFKCGQSGDSYRNCDQKKLWCTLCKKGNHKGKLCRFQRSTHTVNKVQDTGDQEHSFKVKTDIPEKAEFRTDLLVDCGTTAHIINDESKFSSFDSTFRSERHTIDLSIGERLNVAVKRGTACLKFQDSDGRAIDVTLKNALYVPSFP